LKKRVLLVHPYLLPTGGGYALAAWALQGLREECELSLLTIRAVEYEVVNRYFGTSLRREISRSTGFRSGGSR
jgi:hypothetical protein